MGLSVLFSSRPLFFIHGIPRIYFIAPLVIVYTFTLLIVGLLVFKRKYPIVKIVQESWPVFLFFTLVVAWLLHAFILRDSPIVTSTRSDRWWFNYIAYMIAVPFAFVLGMWNRHTSNSRVAQFLVVIFGIFSLLGVAEYLHLSGLPNWLGRTILWVNRQGPATYLPWEWTPGEPVRTSVFMFNPNLYGFMGLFPAAWAIGVQGNPTARIILCLESTVMVFMSGSRLAAIVLMILLAYYLLWIARRRGFIGIQNFISEHKLQIIIVSVIIVILAVASWHLLGGGISGRLATDLRDLDTGVLASSEGINELSSGRFDLWRSAMRLIRQYPLGSGFIFAQFNDISQAHNDFLSLYLLGGPVLTASWLVLAFWIFHFSARKDAQYLGVSLGIMSFCSGLFDGVFVHYTYLYLLFFLIGLYWKPRFLDTVIQNRDGGSV
jgi:hypothetical protein